MGGTGGGITIARAYQNTLQLRDFSLVAGVAGGGTALSITDSGSCAGGKSTSEIQNVAFKGATNTSYYWNNLITTTDISLLNINDSDFFGDSSGTKTVGITYQGVSSCLAVINNLTGDYFGGLNFAYVYGNYAQGVTINQTNFNGGQVGIYSNSGLSSLDQLTVTNSQFNTLEYQIDLQTTPTDLMISNNLFFMPANLSGVILTYGAGSNQHAIISGNTYRMNVGKSGGTGNAISGGAGQTSSGEMITGNVFEGLTNGNYFSNAANWNVQSNAYPGTGNPNNNSNGCTSCTFGGGSQ